MGYIYVPTNFSLSFDIKPLDIAEGANGNILHFSNNWYDSVRMPTVGFQSNTNLLYIRFTGIRLGSGMGFPSAQSQI
jgi:hypothetical protein